MEPAPADESGEEAASPPAADVPSSAPSGADVPSEKASKKKKKKKKPKREDGGDGSDAGQQPQPQPQPPGGGDGAAPPESGDAGGEPRKKRRKKKKAGGDAPPGEKPAVPPDGGTAEEIEAALSQTVPALAGARRRSSFGGTLKGRTLRGLLGGTQRRSASPVDESVDLAATAPPATEAAAVAPPPESKRPGAAALGLLGITATSSEVAESAEAEEAFVPSPSIAQLLPQSSASSSSSLKDMLRTASTGLLGDAQPTGYFRHLFSAGSNLINSVFRGSEEVRPDADAVDGIAPEARAKLAQEKALAQRREREKELAKEQTEHAYNLKKVPYSNPDGKGRGWYWGLKSGMPFPSFHQNPNGKFPSRWVDVENVQQPVEDLRAPRLRLAPGEYEKRRGNIEAMKIKALQRPDKDEAAVDTLNFSYQDLGDPYQFRQLQAAIDLNRRVQQLALTDNQLTTIASFYVPHLTTLYVSRNQFMAWTALPPYLPHLRTLYLSHNFISNTTGLSHEVFPALRKLSLEGNPLCDVRDYKARIREALPLLEVLDGKPVAVTYDEATTFKFLQP